METASRLVDPRVHLGTWINWSRGPVMGSTLTVSKQNGNLIVAFTAVFISFVSTRFWEIISFLFHRYYSTPDSPQDALYHQRQAVLRNTSSTPASTIWTLSSLAWAWRRSKSRRHLVSRVFPPLVAALLSLAAFALAGGFSSLISESSGIGDEVLIDGSNCGIVNYRRLKSFNESIATTGAKDRSRRLSNAAHYAQQCYYGDRDEEAAAGVFDCNSFVVPRIPVSKIVTNASCPFANGICRSESSNLLLDSGYIDSHKHLGMNAPKDKRVLFRQVTQCAPLRTDGYTSNFTSPEGLNYTMYHYGEGVNGGGLSTEAYTLNWTMMAPSIETQYPPEYAHRAVKNLIPIISTIDDADFIPIPDLEKTDGDVFLIFFIGNGVLFSGKMTDDWYRATVKTDALLSTMYTDGKLPSYRPEEAASPMGCFHQYQFCRGDSSNCGPLDGLYDAIFGAAPLFDVLPEDVVVTSNNNSTVSSIYTWWVPTIDLMAGPLEETLSTPASSRPLSDQSLENGVQIKLSDSQWKRDVTHWWYTWLSLIQITFAEMATGPQDSALQHDDWMIRPNTTQQHEICQNQKIQSQRHSSFSMFGTCFIYATGLCIIVISYLMEPLARRFNKGKKTAKDLEWTSTDALHLQSLGFQAHGRGIWSRFDDPVPVTKEGELLEPLIPKQNSSLPKMSEASSESIRHSLSSQEKNTTTVIHHHAIESKAAGAEVDEFKPEAKADSDLHLMKSKTTTTMDSVATLFASSPTTSARTEDDVISPVAVKPPTA